jgi:hypothetical protein
MHPVYLEKKTNSRAYASKHKISLIFQCTEIMGQAFLKPLAHARGSESFALPSRDLHGR